MDTFAKVNGKSNGRTSDFRPPNEHLEDEYGDDYLQNGKEDALEIIQLKWQVNCVFKVIKNFDTGPSGKALGRSEKLKQLGNEAFKCKKLHLALAYYNQALKYCPVPIDLGLLNGYSNGKLTTSGTGESVIASVKATASSEPFSLLIANRSLVLFQLENFQECLHQITLALNSGYPEKLKDKLYKRQMSCEIALEKIERKKKQISPSVEQENEKANRVTNSREEKSCKQKARGKRKNRSKDNEEKDGGESQDFTSRKDTSSSVSSNDSSVSTWSFGKICKITKDECDSVIHPSLKIHKVPDKGGGREVRTSEKVDESKVLIRESAYTWILHSRYFDDYCYFCLKRMTGPKLSESDFDSESEKYLPQQPNTSWNLIPCFTCSQVIFCSIDCRNLAWKYFHSLECGYIELIEKFDDQMYSPFMTLRLVVQEGLKDVLKSIDQDKCSSVPQHQTSSITRGKLDGEKFQARRPRADAKGDEYCDEAEDEDDDEEEREKEGAKAWKREKEARARREHMVTGLLTSRDVDEENIKVTPAPVVRRAAEGHKYEDGYDDHQSVKCNDDGTVTGDVPFHQIYSDTDSEATASPGTGVKKKKSTQTCISSSPSSSSSSSSSSRLSSRWTLAATPTSTSRAVNDIRNFNSQVMPLHQLQYSSYEHFKQLVYHPTVADGVCLEKATFLLTFILFRMKFPLPKGDTWTSVGPLDTLNDHTPIDFLQIIFKFRNLLSQHIRRCQVNSMHITYRTMEYDSSNVPLASPADLLPHLVEHKIGCGLFLATAMINHSCDPNGKVGKFIGKHLNLLSTKLIDPSTEVTISYGLFYKYHSYEYRQSELLNNYYFNCRCKPCLQRWEPTFSAFKCTKCDGPVIEMDKVNHRNNISQIASSNKPVASAGPSVDDDSNATLKCQSALKDEKNEPGESVDEREKEANAINIKRHEQSSNNQIPQTMDESSTKGKVNRTIELNNEKVEHKKVHFKEQAADEEDEQQLIKDGIECNSKSSNRILGKKKVLTCTRCHLTNHLNVKKLSNQLSQGNQLLSQGLQIIFQPEASDVQLIEAVGHLIQAFEVLKGVLYKSHMQNTIVLEYICQILKKLGRFREAIKFGKQLMAIVEEDYDEDVNLFNNQFKLLDIYRLALLQIRRKSDTKGDAPLVDGAGSLIVEEGASLAEKFQKKLQVLLPEESVEFELYQKYIRSFGQLLATCDKNGGHWVKFEDEE